MSEELRKLAESIERDYSRSSARGLVHPPLDFEKAHRLARDYLRLLEDSGVIGLKAEVELNKSRWLSCLTPEEAERLQAENKRLTAEAEGKGVEKRAPVQGWHGGIPWDMHLRAYEVYCKKYGRQEAMVDLEGRGCRGGFHTDELDVFIPGWRDELSTITALKKRIAELEAAPPQAAMPTLTESEIEELYDAVDYLAAQEKSPASDALWKLMSIFPTPTRQEPKP